MLEPERECEMYGLLDMLAGEWTMHVLCALSANGSMRFGVLRRHLRGVSARVLTLRLRTLEERGLVTRTVNATNPPEVTYAPAPRLRDMRGVMHQLHLLAAKRNAEEAATVSAAGR